MPNEPSLDFKTVGEDRKMSGDGHRHVEARLRGITTFIPYRVNERGLYRHVTIGELGTGTDQGNPTV